MRTLLCLTLLAGFAGGFLNISVSYAETVFANPSVDLILPANLASDDAPFYQEAHVKIGAEMIPVREGVLPSGVLAQYQPENKIILISNNARSSETEKGKALLDVISAMQASTIMPAAGR